jgi:hypothetical protein
MLVMEGDSTHSCRHRFATRFDRRGVRFKAIALLGGWRLIDGLGRYLERGAEESRSAGKTDNPYSAKRDNDPIKPLSTLI